MADPAKRVHTLLTDRAVQGLSPTQNEELDLLLGGAPADPSYEQAAAAMELALLPHTESPTASVHAAILDEAGLTFGFTPAGGSGLEEEEEEASENALILEPSIDDVALAAEQAKRNREPEPVRSGAPEEDPLEAGPLEEGLPEDGLLGASMTSGQSPDEALLEDSGDDFQQLDAGFDEDLDEPARAPGKKRALSRTEPLAALSQSASRSTIQPKVRQDGQLVRYATYISGGAALVILTVALWLMAARTRDREPSELIEEITATDDALEWRFTPRSDHAVSESAQGSVHWSTSAELGVMTLEGLAPNEVTEFQYQLWIVDASRDGDPVDGGVFNIEETSGEIQVVVDAKLLVGDPSAFIITVEDPGGVVVSEQERVVMVAAPGE